MTRRRTSAVLARAAVTPLATLAAAGCDGGGGGAVATPSGGASATVSVADTSLGKILVDSQGQRLGSSGGTGGSY